MDENKFNAVKILLNGGASIEDTSSVMKLCRATINVIKRSKDYTEYRTIRETYDSRKKENKAKKQAQTQAQEQKPETMPETPKAINPTVIRVEATHYMMEELKKTNELLTAISAKLAAIVTDLYGVK